MTKARNFTVPLKNMSATCKRHYKHLLIDHCLRKLLLAKYVRRNKSTRKIYVGHRLHMYGFPSLLQNKAVPYRHTRGGYTYMKSPANHYNVADHNMRANHISGDEDQLQQNSTNLLDAKAHY